MSRCSACNEALQESEIIWRPDAHQHEELCLRCRRTISDLENNYSLLSNEKDIEILLKEIVHE